MDDYTNFNDAAAEALIGGETGATDPALAQLLGEMRTTFAASAPVVGHSLAAFFHDPASASLRTSRFARSRAAVAARMAAAIAVATVAMGGLAAAGALPAPVQSAVSKAAATVGLHVPDGASHAAGHGPGFFSATPATADETSTTAGPDTTTDPTHAPNHGGEVSGVAHDGALQGCEHGRAVSATASDKTNDKPCPNVSTTTTTTVDGSNGGAPGTDPHAGVSHGDGTDDVPGGPPAPVTVHRPQG
jgi:hypothetical protein